FFPAGSATQTAIRSRRCEWTANDAECRIPRTEAGTKVWYRLRQRLGRLQIPSPPMLARQKQGAQTHEPPHHRLRPKRILTTQLQPSIFVGQPNRTTD